MMPWKTVKKIIDEYLRKLKSLLCYLVGEEKVLYIGKETKMEI